MKDKINAIKAARDDGTATPQQAAQMVNDLLEAWQKTAVMARTLLNKLFVVNKDLKTFKSDSRALYYVNAAGNKIYLKRNQMRQCAVDRLPGFADCPAQIKSAAYREALAKEYEEEQRQHKHRDNDDTRSQRSLRDDLKDKEQEVVIS